MRQACKSALSGRSPSVNVRDRATCNPKDTVRRGLQVRKTTDKKRRWLWTASEQGRGGGSISWQVVSVLACRMTAGPGARWRVFPGMALPAPAPRIGRRHRPREAPARPASAAGGAPLKTRDRAPLDTPPTHTLLAMPRACPARAYDASEAMIILARAGIELPLAPTPADDRNSKR